MHQGRMARDGREKRGRQTHSLEEKETGCDILPPPEPASGLAGSQNRAPSRPSYSRKLYISQEKLQERRGTDISWPPTVHQALCKHFMIAISCNPHDNTLRQSLLSLSG